MLASRAHQRYAYTLLLVSFFDAGQRKVEVVGPCLEEEAAAIHEGVW